MKTLDKIKGFVTSANEVCSRRDVVNVALGVTVVFLTIVAAAAAANPDFMLTVAQSGIVDLGIHSCMPRCMDTITTDTGSTFLNMGGLNLTELFNGTVNGTVIEDHFSREYVQRVMPGFNLNWAPA